MLKPEMIPFGPQDATAGAENELLTVVVGDREQADLPRTIRDSNYFRNLVRRASSGDTPSQRLKELEHYLSTNTERVWENSWVTFPVHLMTAYAREVFEADLRSDAPHGNGRRSDAARFFLVRNGLDCLRIPVSYLLKLAMADAISHGPETHSSVRRTGERLMRHFLNDNTSPETFSFYPVRASREESLGKALAEETLRRFLLIQLLVQYANDRFELRSRGQEVQICFAPLTPERQKRLNELVSDSFYRDLFMSPCLSGWGAKGEEKHHYMILCHEVLSRSRLNTMAKLRECGILTRNLVTLPTVSNTSLTNNGTHITIGSLELTARMAGGSGSFGPADEKRIGDLVTKIVEHFLPLFVGTYTAAPYRFDFEDFHPETVLGFLPHELDYSHLRMVWRRWKKKAHLQRLGLSFTPFGPRPLDRAIGRVLRLRGDWIPDQRLMDYLVAPLSTDQNPALDGTIGNQDRLKADLMEMGVFDIRMSFYTLYRQRLYGRMGFCGFEGRHYSQFASLSEDLGAAVDLQRLVTALAFQYALGGVVSHADIPDTPEVESERRQIFFGAAIGLPTFYIRSNSSNGFLRPIAEQAAKTRASRRYGGWTRVCHSAYRKALVERLERDGAALIEAMGMRERIEDLKARLEPNSCRSVAHRLVRGILDEVGGRHPLGVSAERFNAGAERYYRIRLRVQYLQEALGLVADDLKKLPVCLQGKPELGEAVRCILNGEEPEHFFRTVRGTIVDGTASQSVLIKLIRLLLVVVALESERHGVGG